MENKVAILMSTYNGEKYISEQIDSLIKQKDVKIHLYIRDDGSTDNTIHIIKDYMNKYPNIIDLMIGENVGFSESFYSLIVSSGKADYYAFCDQDDIWDEDKLISAVDKISKIYQPCLYGGNMKIFDMVENRKKLLIDNACEDISNREYIQKDLFSNPYGCTMVWNNSLHEQLCKYSKPVTLSHDVWVHLIASCLGIVYFDMTPHINYRVHHSNACGYTPKSKIKKIKKYYKFYIKDNKNLGICLRCNYILSNFPDKSNEMVIAFSQYDKGIREFFCAIYMARKYKILSKKILILMIFKKL